MATSAPTDNIVPPSTPTIRDNPFMQFSIDFEDTIHSSRKPACGYLSPRRHPAHRSFALALLGCTRTRLSSAVRGVTPAESARSAQRRREKHPEALPLRPSDAVAGW